MKRQPAPLALAVATALGTLAALPANAALQTTTSEVSFDNSNSVTDAEGGSATTTSNATLGTSNISQFDSTLGVLTGTTLNLTSTRTQTINVSATGSGTSSSSKTTSGTGSSTANIAAAGVDNTFGSISTNASCTGTKQAGCTSGPVVSTGTATNANLTVSTSNLDSYVGSSTVLVTRTAPELTATQTTSSFPGAESTKYALAWDGKLSATYDYLLHAAPSFDGVSGLLTLDLDFGSVNLNDSVSPLSFSIFNLLAENRIGLDLDEIIFGSGNDGIFSFDTLTFTNLTAGSSNSLNAFFDTSSAGDFFASYILNLSDADFGAASSRYDFALTLNLRGSVNDTNRLISNVPEPGMLALFGMGLLGLTRIRRRPR